MSEVAITGAAAVLDGDLAPGLDSLPEVVRVRALRAERVTQLTLAAAGCALAEAGLAAVGGEPRPRLGVALGTAFGCFLTNAAYQRRLAAEGPRGASPRLFAATVSNAAAGEASIAYRLGGPAVTLAAGGAAGLLAIAHAADLVATGRADAMVAGGMDGIGPPLAAWIASGGFQTGAAPLREAAAVVVLEAEAAARGAAPRGRVLGHGAGFTSRAGGEGAGVAAAVEVALEDAGIRPADLALLALEGSPTTAEPTWRAVRGVLGAAAPRVVSRPRERGETFSAAGPLALLSALAEAPAGAPFLVLAVCPSGHLATLVAVRAEAA